MDVKEFSDERIKLDAMISLCFMDKNSTQEAIDYMINQFPEFSIYEIEERVKLLYEIFGERVKFQN